MPLPFRTVLSSGVSPRAPVSVTLPSSQVLSTSQLGSFAGVTNMVFTYRDLLYYNPKGKVFGVLQLSDQVPTGSPAFAGVAPVYVVQPYINVPFGKAITLAVVLPFANEFVSQSPAGGHRSWTLSPMLTPSWRSPGGTLIAIAFVHTLNPDTNPVSLNRAIACPQLYGQGKLRRIELFGFIYGPFPRRHPRGDDRESPRNRDLL
jgi:hypothetical protein